MSGSEPAIPGRSHGEVSNANEAVEIVRATAAKNIFMAVDPMYPHNLAVQRQDWTSRYGCVNNYFPVFQKRHLTCLGFFSAPQIMLLNG